MSFSWSLYYIWYFSEFENVKHIVISIIILILNLILHLQFCISFFKEGPQIM